ncbi:MAG: DUF6048 family protein [Flavobacteriales bacterium]
MLQKILRYTISFCFLLAFSAQAQTDTTKRKGLVRLNIDLLSPVFGYFSDAPSKRMGGEAMLEFSKNDTLFYVVEAGFHKMEYTRDLYQSTSNGLFLRAGVNRNLMKYYNKKDKDIVYIGARVSASTYQLDYPFFNLDSTYFGKGKSIEVPSATCMAFWVEGVFGTRIEVVKNLFLGADLRGALMVYNTNQSAYKTLFVPGFGNPLSGASLWVNYTVGYKF